MFYTPAPVTAGAVRPARPTRGARPTGIAPATGRRARHKFWLISFAGAICGDFIGRNCGSVA